MFYSLSNKPIFAYTCENTRGQDIILLPKSFFLVPVTCTCRLKLFLSFSSPRARIETVTSSIRGKCLTTELPRFIRVIFQQNGQTFKNLRKKQSTRTKCGRGPRFDPRLRRGKFRCPNMLSLVSFAGMTLDKCIILRIRTLSGCPLCRESHPLCRLKNPMVISIWLLVGFHPATQSVQSTPADNTGKRVWQYI